ncbi:N-glycosylase [Candidatus Pacearchaeota archaeon CG10_big_fil_rev_8_21_14_0_10_34_12]|nr:MAG: N-glycosylase [Candidatus Pacearchaeota archaeon CG10_big_fil_rev_8_21_14_0_10_34_12]
MNSLIQKIQNLKNQDIKNVIDLRVREFSELGKKSSNEIFKELCFCLLTANYSASGGVRIQNEIGDGFLNLNETELAKKLAVLGHRFPNARAKFIFEAQKHKDNIKEILNQYSTDNEKREWLVKNIKGLGFKEASHFLRNIGFNNLAIIDFHIIDILVKNNLIDKPKNKSLTIKKYLEIENTLKELAYKTKLSFGELDLYLWYMETGKVLK